MTCLDFVLLMIRSRTRIFCFVHERLGYVTSNIAQKNIRSHLRCSLEGGKDTVGSSSRAVWSRQPVGLRDSSQQEPSAISLQFNFK